MKKQLPSLSTNFLVSLLSFSVLVVGLSKLVVPSVTSRLRVAAMAVIFDSGLCRVLSISLRAEATLLLVSLGLLVVDLSMLGSSVVDVNAGTPMATLLVL